MLRFKKCLLTLAALVMFSSAPAFASDHGTAEEAKALVEKGIAYIEAHGDAAAYEAFNKKGGEFTDRDLYLFVMGMDGEMLSHGANRGLIGKNLVTMKLKDPDGKYFIDEFVSLMSSSNEGWVDYKWTSPVTKKIGKKSSYLRKLDDVRFIGCGIYKD